MKKKEDIYDFIDEFSFGTLISQCPLVGTHLPFLLDRNHHKNGCLYGHFSKANPHWKSLEDQEVLVIFSGPHSYISPNFYSSSPAVPTWNYVAVHAYGKLSLLDEEDTLSLIKQTVAKYEATLAEQKDKMPDHFVDQQLQGIVGFKVVLSKVEGKIKLGQHRSLADQKGVYQALSQSESPEAVQLAAYMKKVGVGQ